MKLLNRIVITNFTSNTIYYRRENGILASGFKYQSCRQEMVLVEVTPDKSLDEQEFRCYKRKFRTTRSTRFKSFFSDSRLEIKRATKIISDGWNAYTQLNQYGYGHEVIIHSENFVHPDDAEIHTQTVENMWGVIKRVLRKHGTNRSPHEFEYVAEFFFRWQFEYVFFSFIDLIRYKYGF
ncbi:hypothetical protein HZS_7992 [Henneguya salminicola]|nr:hypothetical protein HZS_7992 [Henneguya salminicola]